MAYGPNNKPERNSGQTKGLRALAGALLRAVAGPHGTVEWQVESVTEVTCAIAAHRETSPETDYWTLNRYRLIYDGPAMRFELRTKNEGS